MELRCSAQGDLWCAKGTSPQTGTQQYEAVRSNGGMASCGGTPARGRLLPGRRGSRSLAPQNGEVSARRRKCLPEGTVHVHRWSLPKGVVQLEGGGGLGAGAEDQEREMAGMASCAKGQMATAALRNPPLSTRLREAIEFFLILLSFKLCF